MSGRAGRRGLDDRGMFGCLSISFLLVLRIALKVWQCENFILKFILSAINRQLVVTARIRFNCLPHISCPLMHRPIVAHTSCYMNIFL